VFDPSGRVEPGTEVEVYGIDGATAVVYPVD
jgi:membrane protein implicated in regulation of membrane protease activity